MLEANVPTFQLHTHSIPIYSIYNVCVTTFAEK